MKDIITSVFIIIGLLGGSTMALKSLHDMVRTAALEKAAQGLPPLAGFTRALTTPPKPKKKKPAGKSKIQGLDKLHNQKVSFGTKTDSKKF